MADSGISIKIHIDDEDAEKELKDFSKTVDGLEESLARADAKKPFSGLSEHAGKLRDVISNIGEIGANALHSLGTAASGIKDVFAEIGKVGAKALKAIGSAAVNATKKLISASSEVAEYGDNIDKMSQNMGISAEAYQEWDAVMQHSGTSMESLKSGMNTLTKAAATGSEAFEALGISQEDLASMSREDLFSATIAALQGMEDETQRTYIASQLLGDSASDLGALLNTSAEETQAMKDRVRELGGIMSNESVAAAAQYQDSLQDLQTAFAGVSKGLISEFLPGLSQVMDGLTEIFSGNGESGIQMISAGISSIVDTITAELPQVLEVGAGIITALIEAITANLPTLLEAGTNAVMLIADGVIQNLPAIIEAALQVILTLSNGIAESLPQLLPTVVDVVIQIVETLIDNVDKLIDSAIAIILALADGLIESLPKLLEKAPEIVQKIVDALIENAPKLLKAAFELIVSLAKGLIENIPELLKSVLEIVASIGQGILDNISQIFDVGKQIVSGLWDGIQEKKDWIKEKVSGFFSGIVDGVKGLLGIQSPSKVFASIGDFMMLGMTSGIKDGAKSAVRATEAAISDIEEAATLPRIGRAALPAPAIAAGQIPPMAAGQIVPTSPAFMQQLGQLLNSLSAASAPTVSGPTERGTGSATVILQVNGREFARTIYPFIMSEERRLGTSFINKGLA